MKKNLIFLTVLLFSQIINAQCPTFFINAPSGIVVGCIPPSVPLVAQNTSTLVNVTYTWVSTSTGTATGTSINAFSPAGSNIYTVIASAPTTSCISTQTIAVIQSTTAPSVTVTPLTGAVLCNAAPICFTATSSPTLNIDGQWYGPGAVPIGTISGSPKIICANNPGTYSVSFWNKSTGCATTKTISITSNTIVPSITITPTPGYTISCAVPCVSMAITVDANIAPQSYSWTNVTTSVTTTPITGGYSICVPGQYIAAFKDGRNCTVSQTITVMIDTLRIIPSFSSNIATSNTLTCYNSCLTATGISSPVLSAYSYSWIAPGPITYNSNTISICQAQVTSSTAATNYTVIVQNPANGCIGRYKVPFYKDILVPNYTAVFTPSAITCANSCVYFSPNLTQTTYTGIPVTYTFTSPAPTTTSNISGSPFCIPGTYTMMYTNTLNGCTATTTKTVPLNTTPPLSFAVSNVLIPCGTNSTYITAGSNSLAINYSYNWSGPIGVIMNNPNGYFTSVNMPGTYTVQINDITNGCSVTNTVAVSQATALAVNITGQDTICFGYGTSLTTSVPGATSYSWNTGSTSNLIWVTPTVTTVYTVNVTNSVSVCSGSSSFTVNVSPCSGINEYINNSGIKVIPNPGNGKFRIIIQDMIENAVLRITDNAGREIYLTEIKSESNEIDVSNLAKGIYHCILYSNRKAVKHSKILIE